MLSRVEKWHHDAHTWCQDVKNGICREWKNDIKTCQHPGVKPKSSHCCCRCPDQELALMLSVSGPKSSHCCCLMLSRVEKRRLDEKAWNITSRRACSPVSSPRARTVAVGVRTKSSHCCLRGWLQMTS
jgi:hypothetical protein